MLFFLIIWAAFCDKIAKIRLFGVPLPLHSSAVLRNTLAADGGGLNTGECFTKLAVDFCTWMYGNRRGCPYNPCRGKALNSHLFSSRQPQYKERCQRRTRNRGNNADTPGNSVHNFYDNTWYIDKLRKTHAITPNHHYQGRTRKS